MADGISVLHVEDDADFAALTADLLESASTVGDLSVTTEPTVADALARFDAEPFDCLVTDYDLPDGTGLDVLEAVRDRDGEIPALLFTGKGTEAVASDAFSAGATDYLRKSGGTEQFRLLAKRIENAVETVRARAQRERLLSAIETTGEGIALLDGDTGEYEYVNRAYADIYGYEPAEMVGEHWSLVYPDEETATVREEILPTLEETGVWHGTTTGLRADGSTLVEDHTLSLSEDGDLICSIRDITDQRKRKADLERYSTIVEALGDPVYTVDDEGYITFVNDAYVEFTGYDRESVVGEHVTTVVDEASLERGQAAIRRLLADDATGQVTYEMTVQTSDRGAVRCEDNISLLPMHDGEFRGHAGVLRDISDRKEREHELRRYKQMANAAADMVYVLDADGYIEFVNDAATDLTGYDRETLIGTHVDLFMDEVDIRRGRDLVRRLRSPDGPDSDSYEWTLHRADGRTVPCESHITVVTGEDGLEGTTGVVRDITEQKERERELERTTDLLRRAEETARIGGWATDVEDGRPTDTEWTETLYDIFGLSPERDPPTEDVFEYYHPEDRSRHRAAVERAVATGEGWDQQLRLVTAEGTERWVRNIGEPVERDGEVVAIRGAIQDITEQKERERELERTNERLADFASIVTHDLRNPLEVAQTRLDLLADETDSEHLDHATTALTRMADIIDDTLTLTRQGEAVDDPEPVAVGNLARNCWSLVETADADLVVSPFTVDGDPDRLKQVFENLFRNAVEHGSTNPRSQARGDAVEHGSTGSRTQSDDAPTAGVTITVGPLPDGDGFYVADDGPGIPAEERERVFEGGYSTGDGGTGFGLSIVEQIVQAHGWEIAVTESETGGARFEVTGVDSLSRPE